MFNVLLKMKVEITIYNMEYKLVTIKSRTDFNLVVGSYSYWYRHMT